VVRVVAAPGGNVVEIYRAPGAGMGAKLETLSLAQAMARSDLAAAAKWRPGRSVP